MARPTNSNTPSPRADASPSVEEQWAAKMERLRGRTLAELPVRICDDEQLRERAQDAEAAEQRARFLAEAAPDDEVLAGRVREAAAECEAVRVELEAASIVLRFRALSGPLLEELMSEHPPSDAQAEEGAAFNPDTFAPVLIAAACTDGMSQGEAAELLSTWSAPDRNALWEAAWQVQQQSRVELGKG